MRNFSLFLLCTCLSVLPLHAQENSDLKGTACIPVQTVNEDELVFQAGETMDFVLQYNWLGLNADVGYATVRLDSLDFNGEKAFLCDAQGWTARFFDFFFKVREDFKSWFTRDGLRPLKFTRDTHEGGYKAKNTYIYDWNQPEPHIVAYCWSNKKGQKSLDIPLTPCTFDLPSLFFYARNMDLDKVEPGRKYPMTFAIDDEVFNVYFILHGREKITVEGLGTVNTIKFGAKLLEGEVFKGDKDMLIWISDDRNRVPVYFEAPLLVGLATGRMTGCKGLKHPFEALLEDNRMN